MGVTFWLVESMLTYTEKAYCQQSLNYGMMYFVISSKTKEQNVMKKGVFCLKKKTLMSADFRTTGKQLLTE